MRFRDYFKDRIYSLVILIVLLVPAVLLMRAYRLETPAIARTSGWCAHRLEELVNKGKIIRPAYKYVGTHCDYVEMDERTGEEQ